MSALKQSAAPPELSALQAWMLKAVCASTDQGRTWEDCQERVTSSATQTAAQRVAVYVEDYWTRVRDSLSEDFPKTKGLIGAGFLAVVTDYLQAHPSRSTSLVMLGQHLPKYLESHYMESNRDMVLDAVRWEWAKNQAWITPNQPSFDPNTLTIEQALQLTRCRWELQPSLTLLRLRYNVADWTSADTDEPVPLSHCQMVFQRHFLPETLRLEPVFFDVLSAVGRGCSLSEAVDELVGMYPDQNISALSESVQRGFSFCVTQGILVHPQFLKKET